MLPFFRPRNDKDIGDKLLGKRKKYRLPRNGSAVAVTGTLLAYYRREVLPDGLMPPSGGRVELLAILRTQAGRFFLYYVVTYPETEDIAGRQEYVHVCQDFEAVRDFLGAMAYPNRDRFAEAVLAAARNSLTPPAAKGGPVPKAEVPAQGPAVPGADGAVDVPPIAPADLPPDAPSDVPPDAPFDLPPGGQTDTPPDAPADVPPRVPTDAPSGTAVYRPARPLIPPSDPKASRSA